MSRLASGLKAWAIQRGTAIYIGLFLVYFIGTWMISGPTTSAELQYWIGGPLMSVATMVFVVAVLMHAWIGVRDILIDYVHPTAIRMTVLALVALMLVACGLWALQILILTRIA